MFGDKTARERPFASLRVTLLEWCPGCHSEPFASLKGKLREGSLSLGRVQILRCAQDDRHYLQMSGKEERRQNDG